jgi:hypothetical protein
MAATHKPAARAKAPLCIKLPLLARPIRRTGATDPHRAELTNSGLECADCLAACERAGGPFRSICTDLCRTVCG